MKTAKILVMAIKNPLFENIEGLDKNKEILCLSYKDFECVVFKDWSTRYAQ